MQDHDKFELVPILGERTNDEEKQQRQENNNQKMSQIVKGIVFAFIWAFLCAVSRICVQALENRYAK